MVTAQKWNSFNRSATEYKYMMKHDMVGTKVYFIPVMGITEVGQSIALWHILPHSDVKELREMF